MVVTLFAACVLIPEAMLIRWFSLYLLPWSTRDSGRPHRDAFLVSAQNASALDLRSLNRQVGFAAHFT